MQPDYTIYIGLDPTLKIVFSASARFLESERKNRSETMKLYDRHTSPNCPKNRVVLYEKNLSYETIPVDLVKKEQKKPESSR